MKIPLCLILLFISHLHCFSQELGNVTLKELDEKFYSEDTSAVAAILSKKVHTKFIYKYGSGFTTQTTFDIKIKIYKKEGLDWANFEVTYFVGYEVPNVDYIKFSKAATYNKNNGKIEKTLLNNQGQFKQSVSKFFKKKAITLPNVKVGSVVEFRYVLNSTQIVRLPDVQFQYSIPVKYVEYISEIPESYIYNETVRGSLNVETSKKLESASQLYMTPYFTSRNLEYNQVKSNFKIRNVPAIKSEPFIANLSNYRSKLIQELSMVRIHGEPIEKFANTWEDVAKTLYESKGFGEQLIITNYFVKDLERIKESCSNNEECLQSIFDFVKKTMLWDGTDGIYVYDGLEDAYKAKTGNIAEINLLLLSMLNYCGIKAEPVLISTRENGIKILPSRTAFDYVIVQAEINNKKFLLDASETFSDLNILPFRAINGVGRLIRKNGSNEEIIVTPTKPSKIINNIIAKVNPDGNISGTAKIQKLDQYALDERQNYKLLGKDKYLDVLESNYDPTEISEPIVENEVDIKLPFIENFSFKSQTHAEIIGSKMYISPLLFFTETSNPFKQENREFPVDFGYPYQHKYNINIEIPSEYEIEFIPSSINIGTEGQLGSFKYVIASNGNKIQLAVTTDINYAVISTDFYQTLKKFFENRISKQNEKIILKKIGT